MKGILSTLVITIDFVRIPYLSSTKLKVSVDSFVKKHLRKCNFSKKGYCKNRLQIQIVTFISL